MAPSTQHRSPDALRPERTRILGCPVDLVDMRTAVACVVALSEGRLRDAAPGVVVTLNPEMVMRAQRDRAFRHALESAALLVPDGIGIVRALRRRGHRHVERVAGADLLLAYLPEAVRRGHRIALAGGEPGVAQEAGRRLQAMFPGLQIVAADSGAADAALARRLSAFRPQLVLAGFGAGLQELFLLRYLAAIGASGGIGVGGTLDYISGRVRRAPRVLRRGGLEWAWRLTNQPWRLRRQLVLPRYWWMERREAAAAHERPSAG